MPYETMTASEGESTWEQEWDNWWQGYWSDAADASTPEPAAYGWRESAHEFDFGPDK